MSQSRGTPMLQNKKIIVTLFFIYCIYLVLLTSVFIFCVFVFVAVIQTCQAIAVFVNSPLDAKTFCSLVTEWRSCGVCEEQYNY